MKRLSALLVAAVLLPLAGCKWIEEMKNGKGPPKSTEPLPPVQPDQLVGYLNERAARLQSLYYGDVRLSASERGMPLPALSGSLAASQPRNFRMTVSGKIAGKVDLGSNPELFWVYFDGAGSKPLYVFASHTDFESGRAPLPGGIPFEPDWVMQALGMTTFPPNNQYTTSVDQKARTYTLAWPTSTPGGQSITKEIVFDGDPAIGNKPQVKRHVIRDTKGKVVCFADVKQVRTVELDPRTGRPLPAGATPDPASERQVIQHPTLVVLKWEEQRFEMELELKTGKVNEPLTEEASRRLFTRPNVAGATAVDLAQYNAPIK